MSRLTRDGTAEPVSRDLILRHVRGQMNIPFPCSADHEQDWQPYPVDSYSFLFLFFSLISLIADGPHHYHPACGHKGSSHLSPVHALQFFYRDVSSALLQLVNQWLNFTYSRSHAFRCERKNTNPTKVRIELTTSALAGMQVTY